jgi:hypothetical protein
MAITITKAKPAKAAPIQSPKAEIEPKDLSVEQLADEYGRLSDELQALEADPRYLRLKEVKEALKEKLSVYEPEDTLTVKGAHWMLDIGACSKSPRKLVDKEATIKYMGKDTFMKLASVSVGDAEKYLTPEQVAKVMSEPAYTENRKITPHYLG